MSVFFRLLAEEKKAEALEEACADTRRGKRNLYTFQIHSSAFDAIPGKPFAYWAKEEERRAFQNFPKFESGDRTVKQGLATADDFRFLRSWWEQNINKLKYKWHPFAKGGIYSSFYADVYLTANWSANGAEIKNNLNDKGNVRSNVWMLKDTAEIYFFRPALTWPRRTNGLSFRVLPSGCIFADKGPAAFIDNNSPDKLLTLNAILNSKAFNLLVSLQLSRVELAQSFEVGLIQQTPVPDLNAEQQDTLATLARRAWSLKRTLDTTTETSHAFILPVALRPRLGDYDPPAIEAELARIQGEIDTIAFDLYGFSAADRLAASGGAPGAGAGVEADDDLAAAGHADGAPDDGDDDDDAAQADAPAQDALLSWAVGVAFGRFDWRLATGERAAPPEPEPFDPLPAKSPGMLPDGAAPFHAHAGILVDDPGHPHDLARLIEDVLVRVEAPAPDELRRWLQRDFFAFHLQRYSKSRRKAPIYWPLSTPSGSYTLWLYYPALTSQTLYTAINDFVEPKLQAVGRDVSALRDKGGARTRGDEKQFEALQALERELFELRDTLQAIAPGYQPRHDDGVQITAAPLWQLFRHKPWQKLLKDTWAKLEKGDYDWAHLALNYWPERVREKCKSDKSLAIAHGLEALYVEPEAAPKKPRGGKKKDAS